MEKALRLSTNLQIEGKEYDAGDIFVEAVPKHVAIIMDGNGRWATFRGKPRTYGHYAGAEVLRTIVKTADALGIKAITAYAFSTENWKRPKVEVNILMSLIDTYLTKEINEFNKNNVRVIFSGDRSDLPKKLQDKMLSTTEITKNNNGLTLNLAINYGSRAEILRATKLIAQDVNAGNIQLDDIKEDLFERYLYTQGLGPVDLMIRPGGDMRISNFLLWQIAYAEIWLTKTFWPDFTPELLIQAVKDFQARDRRFGGLNKK